MSKIQAEIMEATELKSVRNEDRQDLIKRLMVGVGRLSDEAWDGLSQDARDWFNAAADAQNAKKKELPDFPDLADEKADEPKTSRRGKADSAPAEPKVGVVAKITTKRGKSATGKIVEIDGDVVVIKLGDGSEEEFDRTRVESIEVAGGEADADEGDAVKVGANVTVVTKRGKEVTGKIVELDDEVVVLEVDGKDEEFSRDRVETIKPAGKASKDEPAASGRRGSSTAEPEEKAKRVSNAEGVSIGTRIKELIAEDVEATEADIAKALKKEGIDFKENTLKLNYVDAHKFLVILKKAKKLK